MNKKILYLALNYPVIGKSNSLYTDLMEEFRDNGYEVTVIASSEENGEEGVFNESGIQVIRTNTFSQRNVSIVKKGIANVLLPYQYKKAIKKYVKSFDFDFILMPTPPITLYSVVRWLTNKYKIPFYLILRDIFPQNAVDLGLIKKEGLIHSKFRSTEKKLYNLADQIGCMSQGNIDYVIKHNDTIKLDKLHILRNWQKNQVLKKVDKTEIKVKNGLEGKFVVFFGGNISKPQKVENIVQLAKLYKDNPDVVFYIIGRGTEKPKLEQLVIDNELQNFIIKDFLPRDEYQELMLAADVGLVSLDERFTIPNIPSKALSYFNAKIPIIALIDNNTDFGTWIQDEIECGYWSVASKPEQIKYNMDKLLIDKGLVQELGLNGYNYFLKHLSPEIACKVIVDRINDC